MNTAYRVILLILLVCSVNSRAFQIAYFGDSQATLNLGKIAADFYEQLAHECLANQPEAPRFLGFATSSSSFHHWMQDQGIHKRHLCGEDESYSALLLGNGLGQPSTRRLGHFPDFAPEVCVQRVPAFQSAIESIGGAQLVIANFMGNSSYRSVRVRGKKVVADTELGYELLPKFKNTRFDLSKDLEKFLQQLPESSLCLVVTTNPNRASGALRWQRIHAQAVIRRDILASGRCAYVDGMTPEAEEMFRRNPDFLVDRLHISRKGAHWFLNYHRDSLCRALQGL